MGVRLAVPDRNKRVISFIGDGTFLMAPTELVTAAQERLPVTIVIPENHGYQVIHRLQMGRHGTEFGNEFRYRTGPLDLAAEKATPQPRLDGDYLQVDLVQVAQGLGARGIRANTAAEVRAALDETRGHQGPVVIVVPVIPHIDLPGAGAWWDVAPSEVSEDETVQRLRPSTRPGCRSSSGWADPLSSSAKRDSVMSETREIGVGLISVGWMGKLHTRSYQAMPSVYPELGVKCRLVIAADTAPDRVEYATDVLGYERGTTDYREVLDDPDVDVVSICAPNMLHREIGIAAARPASRSGSRSPSAATPGRPPRSPPPPARQAWPPPSATTTATPPRSSTCAS
jgi:hypothetical protein